MSIQLVHCAMYGLNGGVASLRPVTRRPWVQRHGARRPLAQPACLATPTPPTVRLFVSRKHCKARHDHTATWLQTIPFDILRPSGLLEHDGDALAAADAGRSNRVALVEAVQVVHQVGRDARPTRAQRVAKS